MKRLFIVLLACGVMATSSFAQRNKIEFSEFTLDNGLQVILHEDHSTPIVAVTVMYHVGSKNEQPDRTGFAHFFEHLLFEGTENIDRGEYFKIVQGNGGQLNANTTYDRTFYYEVLPSNQLELGLWLESERLLHAVIDQEGVETQREVVKEERRLRVDNRPYGRLVQETMKRVYTKHPYRWPVIGSLEHLNEATLDEFIQFYKDFYVPENAILSIAGDIDPATTKMLVEKYFGEIPRGSKEVYRPTIVEPAQTKEVRDTVYDKVQLPAIVHTFKMPAQGTPDYYPMDMLMTVMSRGQSSRLYKSLVDEEQKAVQVFAFPFSLEDPGVALVASIINIGQDVASVETSMEKQYDLIKGDLISDFEMDKLRNQIENDFVSSNSRMSGIAENLANYKMYLGDANLINTELERYQAVSREDLQRVAKKYLTKENRVTLYWLPEPK